MSVVLAEVDMLEGTLTHFHRVAERCSLNQRITALLSQPRERIEVSLNPLLSDGDVHEFKAFIVHHNRLLGPAKGGIRMSPTVTLDDVTAWRWR